MHFKSSLVPHPQLNLVILISIDSLIVFKNIHDLKEDSFRVEAVYTYLPRCFLSVESLR